MSYNDSIRCNCEKIDRWTKIKNFILYGPFLWMGFNYLKATEPLGRGSLLFTSKFSEIASTHLIDLLRMNNWKRPPFSRLSTSLLFTSFSNIFPITERRLTWQEFLAIDLSLTFLNTGTKDKDLAAIWKTSFLHRYWRLQLVFMKIQTYSSL